MNLAPEMTRFSLSSAISTFFLSVFSCSSSCPSDTASLNFFHP